LALCPKGNWGSAQAGADFLIFYPSVLPLGKTLELFICHAKFFFANFEFIFGIRGHELARRGEKNNN